MAEENILNRKKFLQLSTRLALSLAGLLGLGGLVRYFSHKPSTNTPSSFDLGLAAEFPISGKLIRLDIPAVIYLTQNGYQAYSLVCTHLGCTVEEDGENFNCPCHGSQFDQDGNVLKGPASNRLPALKVLQTEDGKLILETKGAGK